MAASRLLAVACVLGCGCLGATLRGAALVSSPPAGPAAEYVVESCTEIATSSRIEMPDPIRYSLVETPDGPVLYELDPSGSGARVMNHWVQEGGADIFFMWQVRGDGLQWVLPRDRAAGGVRFVYRAGTFEPLPEGGVSKVSGIAEIWCPMIAR